MEIKSEGDEWKLQNFYEIQAAFKRYEEARKTLIEDPDARTSEGENEEYECGGTFPGFARFMRWEAFMEPRVYT